MPSTRSRSVSSRTVRVDAEEGDDEEDERAFPALARVITFVRGLGVEDAGECCERVGQRQHQKRHDVERRLIAGDGVEDRDRGREIEVAARRSLDGVQRAGQLAVDRGDIANGGQRREHHREADGEPDRVGKHPRQRQTREAHADMEHLAADLRVDGAGRDEAAHHRHRADEAHDQADGGDRAMDHWISSTTKAR